MFGKHILRICKEVLKRTKKISPKVLCSFKNYIEDFSAVRANLFPQQICQPVQVIIPELKLKVFERSADFDLLLITLKVFS